MTDGLSEKNLQNLLKTIESTIKVNTQEIERGIDPERAAGRIETCKSLLRFIDEWRMDEIDSEE